MNIKDKYLACMLLHSLGDEIGFGNGAVEFNYGKLDNVTTHMNLEYLMEFIANGGVNEFDTKGLIASDDTILHMCTTKALLSNFSTVNEFGLSLKNEYIKIFDDEFYNKRGYGKQTVNAITSLKRGTLWNNVIYDRGAIGNGAAMRTPCIGLAFYGKTKRKKLMVAALESSRLTHNSAAGILSGITVALFTAYAIEEKNIEDWPFKLIKFLNSGIVDEYINKTRPNDYNDYIQDKKNYTGLWNKYLDKRFIGRKFQEIDSMKNVMIRSDWFYDSFNYHRSEHISKKKIYSNIGGTGYDCNLVAYDALISCKGSWETLMIYSMLHIGDSDTTGCIAASWFGAFYGFSKFIPEKMIKNLEFRKDIEKISNELYEKYGVNNSEILGEVL
jgi:ADP-ribosylglycohydrolase